jgi:hypothetical protein
LDTLADELEHKATCTTATTAKQALPMDSHHQQQICCDAVGAARSALDRVGLVVWSFPSSSNLSDAPYRDDTVLMHSVLDGVMQQIDIVNTVIASGACSLVG